MTKKIEDRLIREILRALDGKWAGTRPQMLAGRISYLEWDAKDDKLPASALDKDEASWLGRELLRLVQTGDTKTLRQIADARDHLRKDGEVFNRKRYERLRTYLRVYEREGRPPKIKELVKPSGDAKRDMNNERAIRKLLDGLDLPYTDVRTGRPKGSTDSIKRGANSERLRRLRSLLLS
jgi:hypothetical protein